MAEKGSAVVISCSTDGGTTYNNVLDLNSVTDNESGSTIEVTAFGDSWKNFLAGLNEFSVDLGGHWNPNDTTGQVALRDAWRNGTAINLKILYDGTHGVSGDCLVTKVERKAQPDGTVEVSFSLQGTGAVTDI